MSRFLFTMLPANDLGLPTRLVPIARALADRGHEVAVFNPAPAPTALIADAGLRNLPMPPRLMPRPPSTWRGRAQGLGRGRDVCLAFFGRRTLCERTRRLHVDLMRDFNPDVVVDSFGAVRLLGHACSAHPAGERPAGQFSSAERRIQVVGGERPANLPSATPVFNTVAAEYGLAPIKRCVDLLAGDLSLIVGTPETDPFSVGVR